MEIFGVPLLAMLSQLLPGLVNGSFYAMLGLDLAVIFGLLSTINFAYGALFMLGAVFTRTGFSHLGVPYWAMLVLSPLMIDLLGTVIEYTLLWFVYKLDHPHGLLLTLGVTFVIEGVFRAIYGVSSLSYGAPQLLQGATDLGFMMLPSYRAWVVMASLAVCFVMWFMIGKTKLGVYLRTGTGNLKLAEAPGVNAPLMVTLTYGLGVALAVFAGALVAPAVQISPPMGQSMIITVFVVMVIGGMGSILGSIITGLGLGMIEGLTKMFYPQALATIVFVVMVLVLLVCLMGLLGKEKRAARLT